MSVDDNISTATVWGEEYRVIREAMDWAKRRPDGDRSEDRRRGPR